MKLLSFFGICVLIFSQSMLQAQEVKVKMKKYPVTKTFSLGQRGLLLYGEDPNKNSNQKEIVLIKDGIIDWYSQFMPSNYNVIPVYANESNYVYFVEEGYAKGGELGYVFIDNSGTSRKGKLNISMEMRKIGVKDASKLELIQMYSASQYFVVLFEEKSGSELSYYALFVAHGSQKVYTMKLVHSSFESKDKFKSPFEFIGTSQGKLLFAQRAWEGGFQGFYLSMIDPKNGKDETRKFAFPISKMSLNQKIYTKGFYDAKERPISSSTIVKSRAYQGGVILRKDFIYMYGVDITSDVQTMQIKKADVNGNKIWQTKYIFDPDNLDQNKLLAKLKSGNFGLQFEKSKDHLMGAISGRMTMLFYIDIEKGNLSHEDYEAYGLETLNKNVYYIFENLRNKKYAWFQFCGADFYKTEQLFMNKKEFSIIRHKL